MDKNSHSAEQPKAKEPVPVTRPANDSDKSDPPNNERNCKKTDSNSQLRKFLEGPNSVNIREWISALSTFGLLVLSVIVGIFAFGQWRATERALILTQASVEDARKSFEITRRARLFFTDGPQISFTVPDVFYNFDVQITNSGESAAESVFGRTGWTLLPSSAPFPTNPQFPPLTSPHGGARIAPKGTVGKNFIVGPLSKGDIANIASESVGLFIYSRVEYSDGFGHTRYVLFCSRWEYHTTRWVGCDSYNDGD